MGKQLEYIREFMVDTYTKTLSLKATVKYVSKKLGVSERTLAVDWHRRDKWPKKVFDDVNSPVLRDFYVLAIHRTLRQIEKELTQNTNPSCRVGLLKTKSEILFKLLEVQKYVVEQDLAKRIGDMEKKLEFLVSNKQKDEVH